MGGFTEGGLELQSSIVEKLEELLDPQGHVLSAEAAAAAAAAAPSAPYVSAIIAAAAFIAEVIEWMSQDDRVERALKMLAEAIEHLRFLLDVLDTRLDEFILEAAIEFNRQTNARLKDYLDDVLDVSSELRNLPANDVDTAVVVANRAGIIADKFLRDDYDIWRWVDVVIKEFPNPQGGAPLREPDLALGRFKNLPTLPVYQLAVLTWLAARERAVRLNAAGRLDDDAERVRRHLDALTVRPTFRKLGPEVRYPDGSIQWTAIPQSLPEHIKARIAGIIRTSSRYPENGLCHFWFDVQNWMDGSQANGGTFDLVAEDNNALCMVDPLSVSPPDLELLWEETGGLTVLEALRRELEQVARAGTLRRQYIGRFPNWTAGMASYYAINPPGQLLWFGHLWKSDAPGVPISLAGPRPLAARWNRFKFVLPAGGHGIYAVEPDGTLLWFRHQNVYTGGEGPLSDAVVAGSGWQNFAMIASGGNGVIYAMDPDGTLWWYKNDGFENGTAAWRPRTRVGSGWNSYIAIFSGGEGIVYGIRPDGTLVWYKHNGVDTGADSWEAPVVVGSGWQNFRQVFAVGEGVIYAKPANGPLLWYKHKSWKTAVEQVFAAIGGQQVPLAVNPIPVWEGPVQVGEDSSRYLAMFGAIPKPLPQGGGVR